MLALLPHRIVPANAALALSTATATRKSLFIEILLSEVVYTTLNCDIQKFYGHGARQLFNRRCSQDSRRLLPQRRLLVPNEIHRAEYRGGQRHGHRAQIFLLRPAGVAG